MSWCLAGFAECLDIWQQVGFFRADMFGQVVDVPVEKVAEGGKDRMLGIVVVGKQPDALFDFGELLFKIILMGALDIVYDDLYLIGFEIGCAEDLLFKHTE